MKRALAFTVASLLVAGAAVAKPPLPGVPERAVVVGQPTESGARLYVWDERGGLCGSVANRHSRFASTTCGGVPLSLRTPMISTSGGSRPGRYFVWGTVMPEVASVELVTTSGRRLPAQTTDGAAYHGRYAGELRFFLREVRLRRGEALRYLRLLDADGALLAAADATYPPRGGRRHMTKVASGRVGRARWRLSAFARRDLAPLPGDGERFVTTPCVVLGRNGSETCADPDLRNRVDIALTRSCGPIGIQLVGLAAPGVRVMAVLGDGTRRRLRLHPLPRPYGGLRAFALPLAPAVALRRLVSLDGGRRHVEVDEVAPGLIDCPHSSSSFLFLGLLVPPGPGPPVLQLRDDGVLLCATIGQPDPDAADCGRPPLDPQDSWIFPHVTDAATTVAGIVPASVGSAAVVLADGHVQTAVTAVAYMGQYRDAIRTFSVSIPGRQRLRRIVLYGLDGERLVSQHLFGQPSFAIAPTELAHTRSGWRLGVGAIQADWRSRPYPCLQLARGPFEREPFQCLRSRGRAVQVACSPKRTLLYGWLPGHSRRVEIGTTERRISTSGLSARRIGVRRRAFVVELRAHEALRSIAVPGRKPTRFRLPPAARQCGYAESLF